MADAKICKIEGCSKPFIARGMCTKHYQQWKKLADHSELRARAKSGEPLAWIKTHLDYDGSDCVAWPYGKYPSGYGMINMPYGPVTASRLMCEYAHGEPIGDVYAAHSCGKGHEGCMNPNHLSWKTRAENEADKIGHGTSNRGSRNGQAIINEQIVREIRASDMRTGDLARKYGISAPSVSGIRTGKTWRSVK